MKTHGGSRSTAPCILNLNTRCKWAVIFTFRPLCSRNEPHAHGMGGQVGPTAGFDTLENREISSGGNRAKIWILNCGRLVLNCGRLVLNCGRLVLNCGRLVLNCGRLVLNCGRLVLNFIFKKELRWRWWIGFSCHNISRWQSIVN